MLHTTLIINVLNQAFINAIIENSHINLAYGENEIEINSDNNVSELVNLKIFFFVLLSMINEFFFLLFFFTVVGNWGRPEDGGHKSAGTHRASHKWRG